MARKVTLGAAVVALAALLLVPNASFAEDPPASGSGTGSTAGANEKANYADKKVTLDGDNLRLSEALKQIMESVGANFVLDSALRTATVSTHLTDVRFQVALDTLMKVSSVPVTYKLVDGVYHFSVRTEDPEPPKEPTPPPPGKTPPPSKYSKILVQNFDADELVAFLLGEADSPDFTYGPPTPISNGSISGSRSYSTFGFLNGRIISQSYGYNPYSDPYGGSRNTTTSTGGISFGPFHLPASGGGLGGRH